MLYSFPVTGTVSEFRKKFENPILRGRDADASDAQHKKGAEKLAEVRSFIYKLLGYKLIRILRRSTLFADTVRFLLRLVMESSDFCVIAIVVKLIHAKASQVSARCF